MILMFYQQKKNLFLENILVNLVAKAESGKKLNSAKLKIIINTKVPTPIHNVFDKPHLRYKTYNIIGIKDKKIPPKTPNDRDMVNKINNKNNGSQLFF